MAYNLCDRFPPPPISINLLEPGAYQNTNPPVIRTNKVAFLSKSPRNSGADVRIWTHALYHCDLPTKIPNCTTFLSKLPRFPYEALSKKDLEAILCQCGIKNSSECAIEDNKEETVCQGKIQRRLFKGPVPTSSLAEGISAPSRNDHGFKILRDGTKIRILKKIKTDCPPFYDARVMESTAFYQGCKWSKWTSKRGDRHLETRPGPADYTIETEPSFEDICAEKVRALKRKTSKQFRYIEMVQRRDIFEGRPGPATYTPNFPKGTDLKWLGGRAERFHIGKYEMKPSPTEYCIKRDFDKMKLPQKICHAKLPEPTFFGIKAPRFKRQRDQGPSSTSYDPYYKRSRSVYCNVAPFGSFTDRFKDEIVKEDGEDDLMVTDITSQESRDKYLNIKHDHTWGFKSKSIRMKPLVKKVFEPSPADLPQTNVKISRSHQLQCNSPFLSSERRFQPWFNWIPIQGKDKTPGPAYYCPDKPKCWPAVSCGPLFRTQRFPDKYDKTPAPNAYKVQGGIENILATHNQKLKDKIGNKPKFRWSPPLEPKKLSLGEQESALLKKSIALLDVHDIFELKKFENKTSPPPKFLTMQTKLLRCFLQTQQMPQYF